MKNPIDRLIKIKKGKIQVSTDVIGAQLASIVVSGKYHDLEIMNQGLLDPENSAYAKTAPNLVISPGPAAKFDKKTLSPAKNVQGDDLPIIEGYVDSKKVIAVNYLYNNFPYLATQHGWSQYSMYNIQGGAKRGDDYYILVSQDDEMSPFTYRHHVACSIEDDGRIKYITQLTNNGNAPIPGGLGWHPVFKLYGDTERYTAVFENVEFESEDDKEESLIYEGLEIDCSSIIEGGKGVKFDGVKSATVTIYYETQNGERVPYLSLSAECPVWVLWGKGDGFAIEPWNTKATKIFEHIANQNDLSFADDKGFKILQPGESTSIVSTIDVNFEFIRILAKEYEIELDKGKREEPLTQKLYISR